MSQAKRERRKQPTGGSPGHPKGSRNIKTLERESRQRAQSYTAPPPRPRGKPVGGKDSRPKGEE